MLNVISGGTGAAISKLYSFSLKESLLTDVKRVRLLSVTFSFSHNG